MPLDLIWAALQSVFYQVFAHTHTSEHVLKIIRIGSISQLFLIDVKE
jgi:hypothetical protein